MSPVIAVTCSALDRAAMLIEKGVSPAKAFRQVSRELIEYAERHAMQAIPARSFAGQLGEAPQPMRSVG